MAKRDLPDYTNDQIAALIENVVNSERDRAILRRCRIDGIRFEPLSEEFKLSVRRVKDIVGKETMRLSKYL